MSKSVEITFVVDVDDDATLFDVTESAVASAGVALQDVAIVRRVRAVSAAIETPTIVDAGWRS